MCVSWRESSYLMTSSKAVRQMLNTHIQDLRVSHKILWDDHQNKCISLSSDPYFRKSNVLIQVSLSLSACPSDKFSVKMKMIVGHWCSDTDRGKSNYFGTNKLLYNFVYHNSRVDWHGIVPASLWFGKHILSNSYINVQFPPHREHNRF
jgi:hypothetical protein